MEKPCKSSQDSEVKDSAEVEAAEETSDEPKKPENPDNQAQGQAAEVETKTENEASVVLPGSSSHESGEILEPHVELYEKSIQIQPEDLSTTAGIKHEAGDGEYQEADVAASAEHSEESVQSEPEDLSTKTGMKRKAGDGECQAAEAAAAAPEEIQDSGKGVVYSISVSKIVEEVMNLTKTKHAPTPKTAQQVEESEDNSERIQEQQNVPEALRDLEEGRIAEPGELPHQQLQVQQVEQLELVLQEAVIDDVRQPVEEAEDIEEPQKYAFREKENE